MYGFYLDITVITSILIINEAVDITHPVAGQKDMARDHANSSHQNAKKYISFLQQLTWNTRNSSRVVQLLGLLAYQPKSSLLCNLNI